MIDYIKSKRTYLVFLSDIIITIICLYLAIMLRHDLWPVPLFFYPTQAWLLLSTFASYTFSYRFLGLYRGIWRFASTPDLERIFKAVTIGTALNLMLLFFFTRLADVPRSIFIIHPVLLILGLGGVRFAYRLYKAKTNVFETKKTRTLIIGAGNAGIRLARDLIQNPEFPSYVVGFLDDDSSKFKRTIDGISVLGKVENVTEIVLKHQVELIILAIPSATKEDFQHILSQCLKTNIPVKTLPKLQDILLGKSRLLQLRDVAPEDFLGRDSVSLDMNAISSMVSGMRVLVTGAGGSIGSEICRQIAKFNPRELVLFELSEFLLYEIEMELRDVFPELKLVTIVGDIRNIEKLRHVFTLYRPELVLHAAAYKQVPLMERNPFEAINTNVRGGQNLAQVAREFKTPRFVFISTDKAVNPTNVMGASKRITEMVINAEQDKTQDTLFTVVRFGNVLGSNGSVIPLFKKQIQNGGPVTVTHPEITRYFMSIPEACQLVLQSAAMSRHGEIFVLDMGSPVKIYDLAKQMISVVGLIPDVDIKIAFTGLREGEKLYEELLADEENTTETSHPGIRVGKKRSNQNDFELKLQRLLAIKESTGPEEIHKLIKDLVPEFTSSLSVQGK